MKRFFNWYFYAGLLLVLVSASLYFLHYILFHDAHHIFLYLVSDIAFLPVEVLLVTLVIDRFLGKREKQVMLKKMNMVIGVFFSEFGVDFLKRLSSFDKHFGSLKGKLMAGIKAGSRKDFKEAEKSLKDYDCMIDSKSGDLPELLKYLKLNRGILLRLLENSNLLEHESFSELLWAVSHLSEELAFQVSASRASNSDYVHLSGDIKRAYLLLIIEWVKYMRHLREEYPYLFSLAIRMNQLALPDDNGGQESEAGK